MAQQEKRRWPERRAWMGVLRPGHRSVPEAVSKGWYACCVQGVGGSMQQTVVLAPSGAAKGGSCSLTSKCLML